MTEPLYGVDISNWNGRLSAEQAQCLAAGGFTCAVVRLSLETADKIAIARQQVGALQRAGLTVAGYLWCYFSEEPESTAQQALNEYADLNLTLWWLDAEETDPRWSGAGPGSRRDWLTRCLHTLDDARASGGIYTGAWWWRPYMADTDAFTAWPLWVAEYDGIPALTAFTPFGGWDACQGKQYTASGSPCGFQNLDLNVFDPALFATPPPEEAPMTARQMQIAQDEIAANIRKALAYKLPKKAREALEAGALPAAETLGRGEE